MFKWTKEGSDEVHVTVTTKTFIRFAVFVICLYVLYFVARRASHALLLIFTAFFLALALNSPVFWISSRLPGKGKNSRFWATSIAYLIVIVVLGLFLASIVPPLIRQTDSFVKQAPHLIKEYKTESGPIGHFVRKYHLQNDIDKLSQQLQARIGHISGSAFSTVEKVGSSIFSTLAVLVLTFMMLVEGPRWIRFTKRVVPSKHHGLFEQMSNDMYSVIKGYVNGQVLLAAIAATVMAPILIVMHVHYVAALCVIIFFCGLIPMVGHTIGAIIVTAVSLFHSLESAVVVLAYYLLYMQIEAYVLQPKIQANSTNMSPLLVFMSLVIGLSFGGLLGGLVAIPIAGCLRIVVLEYFYSKEIIENPKEKAKLLGTK
ncbi:MAG TPA: AI-2E family transporter [Candidatus Sulfotelmatobacter sp.]|nr:AI-2E family transporter [Candidatus Sulfotelmatobacter sp.]